MADESNNPDAFGQVTGEGFHELVGHRLARWEENLAELVLDVDARHLNRSGVLHGGVLSTLIDAVCGFAGCYSPDPADRRGCITLSLTVSFTGQVSGGTIRAVGRRRAGGRRIFAATGEVFSADGELIAMGEGTFRLRSTPLAAE
ncbi:PaaI family thioesterase [Aquisalimonas lutea]|uniref:PaaI family thioesterase n=1 Tax=Aquisalimonas lutea TaxID=1327750 RepID=UPI0025B56844|nr:PaaI family thioesterase [Aquisalimonas lutea]MDN3517807.1 PaaI family thioesterase [Aquisalimonas lutea]